MGNLGLISMPCIVFYVMQLFIDAYICNAWASKYENRAAVIEKRCVAGPWGAVHTALWRLLAMCGSSDTMAGSAHTCSSGGWGRQLACCAVEYNL